MSKQRRVTTTTVVTETITTHSGMAFAQIEIVNGRPRQTRLTVSAQDCGRNRLLIRDLGQLKDVAQAVQELLKAITERIEQETNDA